MELLSLQVFDIVQNKENPKPASSERFFVDYLDIYDEADYVVQEVRSILLQSGAIDDNTKLYIFKDEPSAFVVDGGAIFISDRLISIAPSEQALDWVVTHEKNHTSQEHFAKMRELRHKLERSAQTFSSQYNWMANLRRSEGQADTGAFRDMDKRGQNPTAAFDMLDALDSYTRSKLRSLKYQRLLPHDFSHGDGSFRKSTMRALPRLDNYTSLNAPLTPMNAALNNYILFEVAGLYENGVAGFTHALNTNHTAEMLRRVGNLRPTQVALARNKLIQRIQSLSESEQSADSFLLGVLLRDIYPVLDAAYIKIVFNDRPPESISNAERIAYYLCDVLGSGARVSSDSNANFKKVDELFAEYTKLEMLNRSTEVRLPAADIMQLGLEICQPAVFERFGIYFMYGMPSFVFRLMEFAMDNMLFESEDGDFLVENLTSYAALLYERLYSVHKETSGAHLPLNSFLQPIQKSLNGYGVDAEVLDFAIRQIRAELLGKSESHIETNSKVEQVIRVLEEIQTIPPQNLDRRLVSSKFAELIKTYSSFSDFLGSLVEAKTVLETTPNGLLYENSFTPGIYDAIVTLSYEDILDVITSKFLDEPYDDQSTDHALMAAALHAVITGGFGPGDTWTLHTLLANTVLSNEPLSLSLFETYFSFLEHRQYLDPVSGSITDLSTAVSPSEDELNALRDELTAALYLVLLGIEKGNSQELLMEEIIHLHRKYPLASTGAMLKISRKDPAIHGELDLDLDEKRSYKRLSERHSAFISKLLDEFTFDLNNKLHLEFLYHLSHHMSDTPFVVRYQKAVLERLLESMNVEDAIAFYDSESTAGRLVAPPSLWQNFVDNQPWTQENLAHISERIELQLNSTLNDDSTILHYMAMEQLVHFLPPSKKAEFLAVIVGNGKDDRMLKTYLYRQWMDLRLADKQDINLDELLGELYRLGAEGKLILLTQLLLGDGGVLASPEAFTDFIDYFLRVYVSKPQSEEDVAIVSFLRKVFNQLATENNLDTLFFMFTGLLQENILRLPSEEMRVPWERIIRLEDPGKHFNVSNEYDDGELLRASRASNSIYDRYIGFKAFLKRKQNRENVTYIPTVSKEVEKEILGELFPKQGASSLNTLAYVDVLSHLLGFTLNEPLRGQLTPKQLLRQAAMSGDTIGKRLAQLAWLYVEQDIFDAFGDMFDEAGNSSIVLILRTLLADWPDFWEHIQEPIHGKVAEGSMGAVLRVTPQSWWAKNLGVEGDLAVKVMTPNPDYHASEISKILSSTFANLSESDPAYETATYLIEDVFNWISADYNFSGMLQLDAITRELYHGFHLPDNDYSIRIPRSFIATKSMLVDEFITGSINLSKSSERLNEFADMKQVMKLIVANFVQQIKNGFIHSNLNPGNIAVKPETKEVVYFDRGYVLDLRDSADEKFLLTSITENLDDLLQATPALLNYITNRAELDLGKLSELAPDIMTVMGTDADAVSKLGQVIVLLRRAKVHIPLEISLLVLNLGYLDKLCRKFGFENGFAEALVK